MLNCSGEEVGAKCSFFRELTALDRGAKCCIGGEPNAVAKEKPILLPTGSQML
jgi:hypothetical protein